jgi:nucleotide-binding universal stress UspA family protein
VIINAAEDADLVIVGSRGLNKVQRLLMGSVSSKVVHRAPSDVLVVR